MVVGATGGDENGFLSGAAYVFARRGSEWKWQARLAAAGGVPHEGFGVSVSVSGDTAVVGVRPEAPGGGSVYVFERGDSLWTQRAQLTPRDRRPQDEFGRSVFLHHDTLVAGARGHDELGSAAGSAYVFARRGSEWIQEAELLASDGQTGDLFGASVCTDGETIWVGAYAPVPTRPGSAYVFVREGSTWAQQAKLKASDADKRDWFGFSVAGEGDRVVVGATRSPAGEPGTAYVFRRGGSTWTEEARLVSGETHFDSFGHSVSLRNDTIAVGAPFEAEDGSTTGAAHVFVRCGSEWSERNELLADDGEWADFFGYSVTLDREVVVVGAYADDTSIDDSGSAYAFSLAGESTPYCTAKTNSLGCVPRTATVGCASATEKAGFVVTASDMRNAQPGVLLYGLSGRAATPYSGGVLCLESPLYRTPGRISRGNLPPVVDCSGVLRVDMNAFAAGVAGGTPRPELRIPGTQVQCQWWARDPDDAFGVSLSAGIEYSIAP